MIQPRPRLAVLHAGLGLVDRGIERVLTTLSRHLSEDFDLTMFGSCPSRDTTVVPLLSITRENQGYNAFYSSIPFGKRLLARAHLSPSEVEKLTFSLSALPVMLEGRYDAALVSSGYWGCLLSKLPRALVGTRIICRSGGWMMSSFESAQFHPDVHITDNPEVALALKERYPQDRISHIPNGVDIDAFYPEPDTLGLELERPIYMCAGAFESVKRPHLVIEAVSRLGRGSVLLLGQGDEEPHLRELGNRLLGEGRFLISRASFSEMRDYYNACDVFTLPSERESFGLVCLEAMACGKVVVSHADRVRTDILGQAGIVCDCADLDAYADVLSKAPDAELAVSPREQAKKYSWESVGSQYSDEIHRALGSR